LHQVGLISFNYEEYNKLIILYLAPKQANKKDK